MVPMPMPMLMIIIIIMRRALGKKSVRLSRSLMHELIIQVATVGGGNTAFSDVLSPITYVRWAVRVHLIDGVRRSHLWGFILLILSSFSPMLRIRSNKCEEAIKVADLLTQCQLNSLSSTSDARAETTQMKNEHFKFN